MHTIQAQKVRVVARDGASMPGEVTIHYWNQKERWMRVLKWLGLFWGLALCSFFLPIIHFILVPGFFLGGFISIPFVYQAESGVMGGASICPLCRSDFKIEKSSNQWPLTDVCAQCHVQVTIEKVESSLLA